LLRVEIKVNGFQRQSTAAQILRTWQSGISDTLHQHYMYILSSNMLADVGSSHKRDIGMFSLPFACLTEKEVHL
jgi:hypothetical protein